MQKNVSFVATLRIKKKETLKLESQPLKSLLMVHLLVFVWEEVREPKSYLYSCDPSWTILNTTARDHSYKKSNAYKQGKKILKISTHVIHYLVWYKQEKYNPNFNIGTYPAS